MITIWRNIRWLLMPLLLLGSAEVVETFSFRLSSESGSCRAPWYRRQDDCSTTTTRRPFWRHSTATRRYRSSSSSSFDDNNNNKNEDNEIVMIVDPASLVSRKRQQRRKPRNRRPRNYWTNPKNLKREMKKFWTECAGLDESALEYPLMIPNESLLHHYERHDLRAALASLGGRDVVAQLLGDGARIMPGRWSQAIQDKQIQALLKIDDSLSPHQSPTAGSSGSNNTDSSINNNNNNNNSQGEKWAHQSDRKPKNFWNLQKVIAELYKYVDGVREEHGRPAVWMPRPNEMAASGRDDLRQAMQRFGGTKNICRLAGMVPFREWYFFEGQLELLVLLKEYMDEYEDSDYTTFPNVSDIRRNGYEQLHSLIQYYGGRKYLAHRLGFMNSKSVLLSDDFMGVDWGPFDLAFAIALLNFVRQDHLRRQPPLKNPLLVMPSRQRLLAKEPWLHECVERYGGYENVARRLGLAFFD